MTALPSLDDEDATDAEQHDDEQCGRSEHEETGDERDRAQRDGVGLLVQEHVDGAELGRDDQPEDQQRRHTGNDRTVRPRRRDEEPRRGHGGGHAHREHDDRCVTS